MWFRGSGKSAQHKQSLTLISHSTGDQKSIKLLSVLHQVFPSLHCFIDKISAATFFPVLNKTMNFDVVSQLLSQQLQQIPRSSKPRFQQQTPQRPLPDSSSIPKTSEASVTHKENKGQNEYRAACSLGST